MSWVEKELARHKTEKEVKKIMNSPEYKEIQKERDIEFTKNALMNFALIGCLFLEMKHGYKENGLKNFVTYLKKFVAEIAKDEEVLDASKDYLKSEYGIDVFKEFDV